MIRTDVEHILQDKKAYLANTYFVKRIGLFGSYARDEQSEESDIDILVEFSKPVGFEFFVPMRKSKKVFLTDIYEAIGKIEIYIKGVDYDSFCNKPCTPNRVVTGEPELR